MLSRVLAATVPLWLVLLLWALVLALSLVRALRRHRARSAFYRGMALGRGPVLR